MKLKARKALLTPHTIGAKLYTVDPDDFDKKNVTPKCLVTILDYVPEKNKSLLYCDADGQQWWENLEKTESQWHWADNQELVFWDSERMTPMTLEELPIGTRIRARFGVEDTYPARVMGYDPHSLRHQVQFEITEAEICQTYWMWCTTQDQNSIRPTIIVAEDEDIQVPDKLPESRRGDKPPSYDKEEYLQILRAWFPGRFKKEDKKKKQPKKQNLKLPDSGESSEEKILVLKPKKKKKEKRKKKKRQLNIQQLLNEDDSISDSVSIEPEQPPKSRKRKLSESNAKTSLKRKKKIIAEEVPELSSLGSDEEYGYGETKSGKPPVARVRSQKRKREGADVSPAKRSAIESRDGPTAIPAKSFSKSKLPDEPIVKAPTKIKEFEPQKAGRKVKVAKSISKQHQRRKASKILSKPANAQIVADKIPDKQESPPKAAPKPILKKAKVVRSVRKKDSSWKRALNKGSERLPAPVLRRTGGKKGKTKTKPASSFAPTVKPKPIQPPGPPPMKTKPPAPKKAMPPPPSKAAPVKVDPKKSSFPSDQKDLPAVNDFKRTLNRIPAGYQLCEMSVDGWKCISDNGRVVFIGHGDEKEKSKTWAILKSSSGHYYLWNSRTNEVRWRPMGGEDIDWFGFLDAETLKAIARFEAYNTTLMSKELLYLLLKHEIRKTFTADMTGEKIMEKVCVNEIANIRDRILQHRDQQDYSIMWCDSEKQYYLANKHNFTRKWGPEGWEIIRWEDFFNEELCSLVLEDAEMNPDLQAEIVVEMCNQLVKEFNSWARQHGITEAFKKLNRVAIRERISVMKDTKQKQLEDAVTKINILTDQNSTGDFFDDLPDLGDVDLDEPPPKPINMPPKPTPPNPQVEEPKESLLEALTKHSNQLGLEDMVDILGIDEKKEVEPEPMETSLPDKSEKVVSVKPLASPDVPEVPVKPLAHSWNRLASPASDLVSPVSTLASPDSQLDSPYTPLMPSPMEPGTRPDVQTRTLPLIANAKKELESGISLSDVLESVRSLCKPTDFPQIESELAKVVEKVGEKVPTMKIVDDRPAEPFVELFTTVFEPLLKHRINDKDESWKFREAFAAKLLEPGIKLDDIYKSNKRIRDWFDASFYSEFNNTLKYGPKTELHTKTQASYWQVYLKLLESSTWNQIFGQIIVQLKNSSYLNQDEVWNIIKHLKSISASISSKPEKEKRIWKQKAELLRRLPFADLIQSVIKTKHFDRMYLMSGIRHRVVVQSGRSDLKKTDKDYDAIKFLLANVPKATTMSDMKKILECISNFVEVVVAEKSSKEKLFNTSVNDTIDNLLKPSQELYTEHDVQAASARLMRTLLYSSQGILFRRKMISVLEGSNARYLSREEKSKRYKLVALISGALTFQDMWDEEFKNYIQSSLKSDADTFLAERSTSEETAEWTRWLDLNPVKKHREEFNQFLIRTVQQKDIFHFFAGLAVCCPDDEDDTMQLARLVLKFTRMLAQDSSLRSINENQRLPYLPKLKAQSCVINHEMQTKYGYNGKIDILVVGDGDLTFGRSLSRNFGHFEFGLKHIDKSASRLWVSCYETPFKFLHMYKGGAAVVHEILQRGGRVILGVDATKIKQEFQQRIRETSSKNKFRQETADMKFDRIIFNFPHDLQGGRKGTTQHSMLLKNFFRSALQMLKPDGQIVITLHISKSESTGDWADQWNLWNLEVRLEEAGLTRVRCEDYKRALFDGYHPRNVAGDDFNFERAKCHILERKTKQTTSITAKPIILD